MHKKARVKFILDGIKKIGACPCAICSSKAGAVGSFIPDDLQAFGMSDDEAIYFPICLACLGAGIDIEFLEACLLKAGVKLTLDGEE